MEVPTMNTIQHLLVYFPLSPEQAQTLQALLPQTVIRQYQWPHLTQEDVAQADVVFGNVPAEFLDHAPRLKWVHLASAGTDGYLHLIQRGILLTNGTGAYNDSIAEFMLTLTGALCLNLPAYARNQQQGLWKRVGWSKTIQGSTVVVLGCGNIGTAYARRMHALGAYVIGVRRNAAVCPEGVDELVSMEEADAVLPRADIVAMIMPNTPETDGFMDARRLAMLKPGALLVNCGRGNAVDPEALYAALVEGRLDGAAMDVAYIEPLPADDKLWSAPNLLITPHVAGGWRPGGESSPHMARTVVEIFLKNLRSYLAGEALPNLVDPATGYTKKQG